jgi:SNF family Na+-dependent transporter
VKRAVGAWAAAALALAIGIWPALSTNVLSAVRFHGHGLLELWDAALINWFLPVVALLISQVVAWVLSAELKKAEFTEEQASSGELLYRHWIFLLRYLAPPIVFLALGLQLVGLMH